MKADLDLARHRVRFSLDGWLGIHQPPLTQRRSAPGVDEGRCRAPNDSAEEAVMSEVYLIPAADCSHCSHGELVHFGSGRRRCKAISEHLVWFKMQLLVLNRPLIHSQLEAGPLAQCAVSRSSGVPQETPGGRHDGSRGAIYWNEVSLMPQSVRPRLPLYTLDGRGAWSGMFAPASGRESLFCLGLARRFWQNHSR